MAEEVLNKDNANAVGTARGSLGFFERLALRFTGGYAKGRPAVVGESRGAGQGRAGGNAEQEKAWARVLELPAKLRSQEDWRKGEDRETARRAGELWERLAKTEIEALSNVAQRAAASGWEPAGKMSSQVEAAASEMAAKHSVPQEAAKVFALGWEKSGSLGYGAESGAPRACGLADYGSAAPEKLAALALTARCARRVCEMALGGHPRFEADASGNGEYSQKLGFAAARGVWTAGDGGESGFGGASYGEAAAGLAHEPSLGLMSMAWGALWVEALRHGAAGAGGAEELVEMFVEPWMASHGMGPRKEGLNKWKLPGKGMGGYGLEQTRAGTAARGLEALTGVEQAAMAAGVPAWSLGVGAIPAERWMGAEVASRIESAPTGYWGAGQIAEAERQAWARACAEERRSISEASLSASYSDDPGCRSSEQADCSRQSAVVDAQEGLVDWAMRRGLAAEDAWAPTPECVLRIAAALRRLDGKKTDMFNRFGVPGFKEALSRAGVDFGHGAEAADLAGRFMALAEADEVSKMAQPGRAAKSSMRM